MASVHDVLSDARIGEIASAAEDKLEEPMTVSATDAAVHTRTGSRTGKVAFLDPPEYEAVRSLAGRITGLATDTAEPLQVRTKLSQKYY